MKSFIPDKERVLDSASDLLKTSVYAENLVKVIENTPTDKVFTIGVFGGWGTGKSSVIRTAQEKIEKAHSDVKFITYDAWKYANDSFRRMFLLKIQQELRMKQTEEMQCFYQSEIAEAEPKTKLSAKGLATAVAVLIVISAILFLIPGVKMEWKVAFPTIGTLGTFLVALLNGCFYDLKLSYSKPALFAPEQFEDCFKEMMSKCLKRRNWFQKRWCAIKDYVETGQTSVVGLEKLVVVIDNIDRCPSDMAYQLLTDIKTFLSNADYNLVFVVPVDDEALKKHLFRRWNKQNAEEINKEKEEFLRKFFNITLRIKPHQVTELQYFAHEINRENNLGYSNDTLAIVAKEFADNPRRIIQLLNNLSGDLALYDDDFATKYETVICAALILQEEYPDFYKKATRDLDVIRKFSEETIDGRGDEVNQSLRAFMRVADVVLKQTPIDVLQRIFTNTSSIFSNLPQDVQKAVRTFDAAKVREFANANEQLKTNLMDFVIETLKTDVKYGATSQTTQWIDLISQLFEGGIFDSSRFVEIDAALSQFYQAAIPAVDCQNALCSLGSEMSQMGIIQLRNAIINYLSAEKADEDDSFEGILKGYLTHFTTEKDCSDIAAVVENHYVDNTIDQDIPFTDTQKEILFGNSFVVKQVENLAATDDETRIEDIVWCIKNNTKLSGNTYSTLFSKFIELFGDVRGKNKEQYFAFINDIQPVFDVLSTNSLPKELESLYSLVTDTRGMPNSNYRNHPGYDTQLSILDEVEEEEGKRLVSFCYEVMRVSGGKVNVSASIEKLFSICRGDVVRGALALHAKGVSISQLASVLIKVDNYGNNEELAVLELLFVCLKEGTMTLNDDLVKSKIHSLVDNGHIPEVEAMLERLVTDEKIKNYVVEYVVSLSSDAVNHLPSSIAKHAVSTFNKENAESYKDNDDFLMLVLKQGTTVQVREVVRLMKAKLNAEQDLDSVLKVLDYLDTKDQSLLQSVVGDLRVINDSDSVDEVTKQKITALVDKLLTKK